MLFAIVNCLSYPQRQEKYPKPQYPNYRESKIVKHENNMGLSNYNFSYETSDGSQRQEEAELTNAGSEKEALVVHGSYTYVGTDGVTYKVTYVADENGYRASGEHLPRNI
ncbi:endocuticle structural glycoprotein ABD-5 isoform X2 [Leptinotarsa decemlineata]|nr:endocuticle structural glycoprotein ABD-5-like isoform X2 [Leptinotarsa decemlineata]